MITKRTNGQTLIYNTLHKKTQVYQRKPQQKPNYEGNAVSAPHWHQSMVLLFLYVILISLLLQDIILYNTLAYKDVCAMKRKFKQWMSTIPQISTKRAITSYPKYR